MSDPNEYPRVLYRPGSQEEAHGVSVDLLNVGSDEERDAALADGWSLTPTDAAGEPAAPAPLTLLDSPVKDIAAVLPSLTGEELEALRADETAGKTRKGVLAAIDAAIAALPPAE